MSSRVPFPVLAAAAVLLAGAVPRLQAWDYHGHRIIHQVALAALPADFPSFVHELDNAERIAFLSGEGDRWRNVPDHPLRHSGASWGDHFLDLEELPLAGLDVATLPSLRYEFALQFAAGRARHADRFPSIDPARNADHTREWPGFAPWAIVESYGKLRSAFSYLKVYEELGTAAEIANARANVVYYMGVMGHFVGDCSQPLHTTLHYNGWSGPNPNGYTTWNGFHSWVDGGFLAKAGIVWRDVAGRVAPASPLAIVPRPDGRDPMFVAILDYLVAGNRKVEPLYQLEKDGKIGHGSLAITAEARKFFEDQLLAGGHMLAAIWLTAWHHVTPDNFLRTALGRRQAGGSGAPAVWPSPNQTSKATP